MNTTTPKYSMGELKGGDWILRRNPNGTQTLLCKLDDECKADERAFIVRACNSHEAMVAALENMLANTEGDIEAHRENGESERDIAYLIARCKEMREALQSAKEVQL